MENPGVKRLSLLSMRNREIPRSVNIKLELTEENLDYYLRQEYALSQMCYQADQMTLEAFERSELLAANNSRNVNIQPEELNVVKTDETSDRQMEVEEASNEYSVKQKKCEDIEAVIPKSDDNVEVVKYGFMSNTYKGEYGLEVADKIGDIKRKISHRRYKKKNRTSTVTQESEERPNTVRGTTGKNDIVFKTLDLINISRALKNHKTLYFNCNINNILHVKQSLETFSCIKLSSNDIYGGKSIELRNPYKISYGMYQSLIGLIQSLLLKDQTHIYATPGIDSSHIKIKEITDEPSTDTNSALIPFTGQNTNLNNIPIGVNEVEMFNEPTVLYGSKFFDIDESTIAQNNGEFYPNFVTPLPFKSNLKRKIADESTNKQKKLMRSALKFADVTTFYFERSQGFSSIPTKGGSTLGMANQHFHSSTVGIDEYETKKMLIQSRRKTNNIFYRKTERREKSRNIQALTLNQRVDLLESAQVQIEVNEADDCAYIRSSRQSAGCDCKDYCDPEICGCSLAGIECQVDRPNFPCGCTRENCRNIAGRNEYNHIQVRTHFARTIRKVRMENKGRISKRKQASPSKILFSNLNYELDVDMIHV